ncbi:hypothetical protein BD310DRAFT_937934 [Dichomitus squalens]|uniref:Uncharacterized protein n=1 Tax=Dichomitus squalens TaxID=114155 RepID=A0A4Q9PI12_9APHY|nr:hypothetical protein BD310DRAFT_937934 [Dichomitus squalens]
MLSWSRPLRTPHPRGWPTSRQPRSLLTSLESKRLASNRRPGEVRLSARIHPLLRTRAKMRKHELQQGVLPAWTSTLRATSSTSHGELRAFSRPWKLTASATVQNASFEASTPKSTLADRESGGHWRAHGGLRK